jgi:alpha-D-xyloside xylohydrolase
MPYIYSLAGMVAFENYTMLRSLLFDFGDDEEARNLAGEFMFGPAFLVCPVTEPMRFGPGGAALNRQEAWPCYLPGNPQTLWYDFWTGESYRGGGELSTDAPLEKMPLFVRAGSIVPMETAPLEYSCQTTREPLEIRVYPGADGSFTLYEDSGDGWDYENGKYNRIVMRWNDRERIFSIGPSEHEFSQSLKNRPCMLCIGNEKKKIMYTGKAMEISLM